MDDIFLLNCDVALNNVSNDVKGIFLLKFLIVFYHVLQITKLTEFSNNVDIIFGH